MNGRTGSSENGTHPHRVDGGAWRVADYRAFVEGDIEEGLLELPPEEARHLARARRIGPGEAITVLNGRGRVGNAVVESVSKKSLRIDLRRVRDIPPSGCRLNLAVGALKQSAWDELLAHAVELGVSRLVWVRCAHAVSDPEKGRMEGKRLRWRERMIQACKQSVNPWLPELEVAESVDAAMEGFSEQGAHLLADLRAELPLSAVEPPSTGEVTVWVGPEGDFTAEERKRILRDGGVGVRLGPRILRAETAALALVASLRLGVARPLEDIPGFGNALQDISGLEGSSSGG